MILLLLLLLLATNCYFVQSATDQYGNQIMGSDYKLAGVGLGWDYLEDASRYPIFKEEYLGKKTNDGFYSIPECFYVEDVKRTKYTEDSNIIEKATSFVGAGGSYSYDKTKVFEEQMKSKTVTVSTKYIDHRYTLLASSRCPLNSLFTGYVKDIAFALEFNMINLARWYAENLVKEHGTHYTNRAEIGGIYFADDFLSQNYWKQHKSDLTVIQKVTKKRFLVFSSTSSSVTSEYTQEEKDYYNEVKQKRVETIGGKYIPNMKLDDWSKTLDNNLVVINKEISLISNAIIKFNFPDINETTLNTIRQMVVNVNSDYVRKNIHIGCTERRSVMYDSSANYEETDNQCAELYKFGGTFADTIYCKDYNYNLNPPKCILSQYKCDESHLITKQKSCPSGYKPRTGFYYSTPDVRLNLTECYGDDTKEKGGMLFGGIFSNLQVNLMTGSKSCPPYFAEYPLLDCNKNIICLSLDKENAIEYAVPFFGFTTNCIPNRDTCRNGEKIPINKYGNCDLSYCSRKRDKPFPELKKLPFSVAPREEMELMEKIKSQNKI